jgi:hypothetical protein
METKQRSSQSFCARPGCGLAKSGHGFLAGACSNFIQPGSKEENEAKKAHLSVVETPAPEITKPLGHEVLDRVLLADVERAKDEAIELAKQHLKMGLRSQRAGMPKFALECFVAALLALGPMGAS